MSQTEKEKQTTQYTPYQKDVMKRFTNIYSPYIGAGTLGGLSDLEQKSLNMLKSADVWGPLTTAGKGLLTGTLGAQKISPESASLAFKGSVEDPMWYRWSDKIKPEIKESYSGPGYWGGARAGAVAEGAGDIGRWLGSEESRWMWDVEQANRAIEEAKAGRALSAMGTVPSGLLGWAGGLAGIGGSLQQKLNAITDPQVLSVLQAILGTRPAGTTISESTPSELQKWINWIGLGKEGLDLGTKIGAAL